MKYYFMGLYTVSGGSENFVLNGLTNAILKGFIPYETSMGFHHCENVPSLWNFALNGLNPDETLLCIV
jgi:hypothetical protein